MDGLASLRAEIKRRARSAAVKSGLVLAAVFLLAIAIVFLLLSSVFWLQHEVGGLVPALAIVGGVLLMLALLIALAAARHRARPRHQTHTQASLSVDEMANLRAFAHRHPITAATTAFAVGILLSANPEVSRAIVQGIGRKT